MISGDGVGTLMRLQGKVNAGVYKQPVKDHVLPVLIEAKGLHTRY